jgi:hypothetical protein
MRAQSQFGMINNRVFEALSCGAILVSEDDSGLVDADAHQSSRQVLEELIGAFPEEEGAATDNETKQQENVDSTLLSHFLLFANSSADVSRILTQIKANPRRAQHLRRQAREFILRAHTWPHRVVSILEFYEQIKLAGDGQIRFQFKGPDPAQQLLQSRLHGKPRALILIHEDVISMQDLQYVGIHTIFRLEALFEISLYYWKDFMDTLAEINEPDRDPNVPSETSNDSNCYPYGDMICISTSSAAWLRSFVCLFGIGMPFDDVWEFMEELPAMTERGMLCTLSYKPTLINS